MPSPLARFKKPRQPPQPFLRAEDANALDAEPVAAVLGLAIKRQGRHYELENGMRGTDRGGRMVWCHKDGSGIGDNCALAQTVVGVPFRRALELLLSGDVPAPRPVAPRAPTAVLRLPGSTPEHRQAGRAYLAGRGVSGAALNAAEACGMLAYCAGGVLFVGRDADGTPRSATRRGYRADDPRPKRDLSGTDKSWPAYVPGQPGELWVVEGGVDALALLTRHGASHPSVLVTGGVHVTSWLSTPWVIARLGKLWRCTVAGEWEKDPETQVRTDEQRHKLVGRLQKLLPDVDVSLWMPPSGVKDLGEMLSSVAALKSRNNTETY